MKAGLCLLLLAGAVFAAQNVMLEAPVKEVVLYSNGFAYATREGSASLGAGEFALQIENLTQNAIDASISVLDNTGTLIEIARYSDSFTKTLNRSRLLFFEEILNESMGKNVVVVLEGSQKSGKLVWFDSERIGVASQAGVDIVAVKDVKEIRAPVSELNRTEEYNETEWRRGVRVVVRAGAPATHAVSVGYLVSGASWSEHYKLYLDSDVAEGSALLQAWADISNNVGEDWENVSATLIIGFPRIISGWRPYFTDTGVVRSALKAAAAPAALAEALPSVSAGYWSYTLPYPVSMKSGESSTRPLFSKSVPFKREFVWETENERVHRNYKLNNTGRESLGEGVVRAYIGGKFIGEDSIEFVPPGLEKEIYVADVPEIEVKKTVLNESSREEFNVRETKRRIELSMENRREESAELVVRDSMGYADEVVLVSASVQPAQKPGNVLEWKVPLKKGEKKTIVFEYILRWHQTPRPIY
ncbi:MAG: DUF4139 domain-containing protein [Candidatus Micrarchaeia archaeon]